MSLPSPIHGQHVKSAICADDILPVGQAVVVRFDSIIPQNPPAVFIRYFKSAERSPSNAHRSVAIAPERDGNWRERFERFSHARLSRLFTSTRDFAGVSNFCRYLTGRSIGALAQPRKQSSRRFTQGFFSSVAAVLHEHSETQENCNVRQRL